MGTCERFTHSEGSDCQREAVGRFRIQLEKVGVTDRLLCQGHRDVIQQFGRLLGESACCSEHPGANAGCCPSTVA